MASLALTADAPLPEGYRPFKTDDIVEFVCATESLRERMGLGPEDGPGALSCSEIGDGNLNLVFVVRRAEGGAGAASLILKQALPWVRCIGESWPLPLSRAHFERLALETAHRHAPGLVPEVYHYDDSLALIAMEHLVEPHEVLRGALVRGERHPRCAGDLGEYLALTLFGTSDWGEALPERRRALAEFAGNTSMCELTHGVIFTDPYAGGEHNRHTSPELDGAVASISSDAALRVAVARLKWKFMSSAQALIHGDLHTGSVMVTHESTKVIDPEFAFAGPMGFDLGAIAGNYFLAYFSHAGAGHGTEAGGPGFPEWLLSQAVHIEATFARRVPELWAARDRQVAAGESAAALLERPVFPESEAALAEARASLVADVLVDAAGFAGAKMIRRIVGVAHVADLDAIEDRSVRAACEAAALEAARRIVLAADARTVTSIAQAAQICRDVAKERGLQRAGEI